MCDWCGCRRVPEISALCNEHEKIQELADEASRLVSIRDPGAGDAVRLLKDVLSRHVVREEGGVFAEMKEAGIADRYYVPDLEEEHVEFASALDEPEDIGLSELDSLIEQLVRHINIEEYDVFPAAADLLSDEPAEPAWLGPSGASGS